LGFLKYNQIKNRIAFKGKRMKNKYQNIFGIIVFIFTMSNSIAQTNVSNQSLVGHWTFNNVTDLTEATVGSALELNGNHKDVEGPNDVSGGIRIGKGSYYRASHNIAPNGGEKKVNNYTIVMDIKVHELGKHYVLFQTDSKNKNDGDLFIKKSGVMGSGSTRYTSYVFIPGDWYRVAISVSNGKRHDYYIDGVKAFAGKPGSVDGRFALEPEVLFFADEDGEDNELDIADIKIFSKDLSDDGIKELGGFKHNIPIAETEFYPYLQSPTSSSIYISWAFHGNNPIIEYGLTKNLGEQVTPETTSINGGDQIVNWSTVKLENLKSSTFYYYKVKTDSKESEIYRFKTQPENDNSTEHIRFAVYGDNRTDFEKFAEITDALQSKVTELYGNNIEENLNFVFNVGDIVTRGNVLSQYYVQYFNPIAPMSASIPFMISIGNHEDEAPHYYDFMKYEDFGGAEGEKYYSHRIGKVLFIALNSNPQLRNDTQIEWLDKTLADAENDDSIEWIFPFLHHPGHSELWIVGDTEYVQDRIIPILSKYSKVDLLTYGHSHNYERGTAPNSNMRLMLSGGAGGGLDRWEVTKNIRNYPEIQKSFDHYCYSIVDVDIANKRYEVVTYSLGNPSKELDNIEIDRFFRDKKNETPPETPSIISPERVKVTIPFVINASHYSGANEIMSSQIQVTNKKGNYYSPKIDVIRDFEDIYGVTGAPDYIPINLNDEIDLSQYTVKKKNLYRRVWVRVRYRDKNLQWSEWSEEQTFYIDNPEDSNP